MRQNNSKYGVLMQQRVLKMEWFDQLCRWSGALSPVSHSTRRLHKVRGLRPKHTERFRAALSGCCLQLNWGFIEYSLFLATKSPLNISNISLDIDPAKTSSSLQGQRRHCHECETFPFSKPMFSLPGFSLEAVQYIWIKWIIHMYTILYIFKQRSEIPQKVWEAINFNLTFT